MVFYLLAKALTCIGVLSGVYSSLKVLHYSKKNDIVLEKILEYWIVLGAAAVFEEYTEILFSWIPLYYLAKSILILLLLPEKSTLSSLVISTAVGPIVEIIPNFVKEQLAPSVSLLLYRYGGIVGCWILPPFKTLTEMELDDYEESLINILQELREFRVTKSQERLNLLHPMKS